MYVSIFLVKVAYSHNFKYKQNIKLHNKEDGSWENYAIPGHRHLMQRKIHVCHENLPMQYTEIFFSCKN